MDNMTPEFEEIYGNRRKTIERLKERNKKFAELTRVEFKRVILHIEGELVGFEKDELENLSARFVTHDRTCMFPAQHFEVSGTHFHLTENIMSANNEAPIATGDYDAVIIGHSQFEKIPMSIERQRAVLQEQLDEIVELVQETVCSTRSRIRIAGNDYPAEVVRSKLLKLNSEHIRFVMDCLKQNTTRIRNIRQYLLTALFNAPSTMSSYYTALVAHDMAA